MLVVACVRHLKINWTTLTKSLAERLSLKAILIAYGLMTLLMAISVMKETNFNGLNIGACKNGLFRL